MSLNPESYSPISPRQMYSYDRGLNKSWNMSEYKTPRIYQDPKLEVQKRVWEKQKKGQKTDKYVTKRGFYMDYHIKVQKSIPAPCKYNIIKLSMCLKSLGLSRNCRKNLRVSSLINHSRRILT